MQIMQRHPKPCKDICELQQPCCILLNISVVFHSDDSTLCSAWSPRSFQEVFVYKIHNGAPTGAPALRASPKSPPFSSFRIFIRILSHLSTSICTYFTTPLDDLFLLHLLPHFRCKDCKRPHDMRPKVSSVPLCLACISLPQTLSYLSVQF